MNHIEEIVIRQFKAKAVDLLINFVLHETKSIYTEITFYIPMYILISKPVMIHVSVFYCNVTRKFTRLEYLDPETYHVVNIQIKDIKETKHD